MRRPDVAVISPYPALARAGEVPSGVAHYSACLVDALAEQGLRVHVVAPQLEGEPALVDRGAVVVERAFTRGASALVRAVMAARRSHAPVVHLQHEVFLYGGISSVPALFPALGMLRLAGQAPIVTLHQVVDPAEVDASFTRLHRVRVPPFLARLGLAALQEAVSELAAATIVHATRFAQVVSGSTVIPVGLTRSTPEPRAEARAALGLADDAFVVVCFGFIAPYKGLEAALEAAELAGPSLQLVVAGTDHPRLVAKKDPYGARLRERFGQVARFTGYVPDAQVKTWLSASDALLLAYPRPFAGSGPFADALGYGTPVLSSPALANCLGLPEELVVPIEPVALSKRLVELSEDRRQLVELRAVVESLAARAPWSEVARRHIAIYEEVADADRAAHRSLWPARPR